MALLAAVALALAVGVPTGIVATPLYSRMTPVLWWNYVIWALTAILGGLVVATYVRRPGDRTPRSGAGAASGGGLLAAFAVGCPVCNKLVVATLGVSGALTIWAPVQPALGALSVLGLAWTLRWRLRSTNACPAGSARSQAAAYKVAAETCVLVAQPGDGTASDASPLSRVDAPVARDDLSR